MCDEHDPLHYDLTTIDIATSLTQSLSNVLSDNGETLSEGAKKKINQAIDNMTDVLLLASTRAKIGYEEEEEG